MKIPPHLLWPGMVVGLLGMSVTMVTITVTAAVGDPSFAVERDYYERALRWDEHMAQQRQNDELGWRASLEMRPGGEGTWGELVVTVLGADGAPLEDAAVMGTCFHYAEANSVYTLDFEPDGGVWVAPSPLDRAGLWRVRLEVASGDAVFTNERTIELAAGSVP